MWGSIGAIQPCDPSISKILATALRNEHSFAFVQATMVINNLSDSKYEHDPFLNLYIYCTTIHLLRLSLFPVQTSVNLFLLLWKHKMLEQNTFLVILLPVLKVFSLANKNCKLFYVQRVIFAVLVSFKSSCLTLSLTKQLFENSLLYNAWLNLPVWNPWSLLVDWAVLQNRACVPVSPWARWWFLYTMTRCMRQANK